MPVEKYFNPIELPSWMELIQEPATLSAVDLRKRQIHRIFSIKAGLKPILVKANLRADAAFLFESDPSIKGITIRPATAVPLKAKGKKNIVLDFGIRHCDGQEELILMTYKKQLLESDADADTKTFEPPHWSAVIMCCRAAGRNCRFITDEDIENQKFSITNQRRLLPLVRISKMDPRPDISVCVMEAILHSKSITINELRSVIPGKHLPRLEVEVAGLLHRGIVCAQLNKKPFTSNTPIKSADNDENTL